MARRAQRREVYLDECEEYGDLRVEQDLCECDDSDCSLEFGSALSEEEDDENELISKALELKWIPKVSVTFDLFSFMVFRRACISEYAVLSCASGDVLFSFCFRAATSSSEMEWVQLHPSGLSPYSRLDSRIRLHLVLQQDVGLKRSCGDDVKYEYEGRG